MPRDALTKRWLFRLYLLALAASALWRWWRPVQPPVGPDQRVATLAPLEGVTERPGRVTLAFAERGPDASSAAPPVLLIHGSPGSHGEMLGLARILGQDRRAVAPDLPGFGRSTRQVPDYSIRAHGAYLLALMDSLDIERAHLVGFSMGGGVAISMIGQAAERVASLTLLSAIGAQEFELLGDYALNHAIHGVQLALLWLAREGIPHFGAFDGGFFGIEYARNFFDTDQRPLRGILDAYAGPALIVQGLHDDLVHPAVAREHHRIVPQSGLLMLDDPGATHFMTFTRPDALAPAIGAFLAAADSGRARTRATALPERLEAAARPFDPASLPRAVGLTLAVVLLLIASATFVSEDLACIATGLIVARGTLGFLGGTAACFAGIVIGDLGLYAAGRWLGRPAVRRAPLRWLISDLDIDRSSAWFARHGAWLAFVTRFVPGARLPTYFTAGLLRTRPWLFFAVFVLAAALWTPLLVGLATLFGSQVLAGFTRYQGLALPVVLFLTVVLFAVVTLALPLATWRGRRLLISRWRRLTHWEFWPRWAFYPPIVAYILGLALKYRSLTIWTAANPAIPGGGFVGESKAGILRGLAHAPDRVARWELIPSDGSLDDRVARVREFMSAAGIAFPVVLKPDVGERGGGVAIVPDEAAARRYLALTREPILAQEYVPGVELGVFYYRFPGESRGRIFAITDKRFPTVVGDGRRTLEHLILADERAVVWARMLCGRFASRLATVPAEGDAVRLVELGTHSRGATFYDGEWARTPALEAAIDELSRGYAGFWFGRYDIRAPSADAARAGTGFKVIELNGAAAEATNIYDPRNRLSAAYRVLRRQWAILFEIAARNVAAGATPASLREMIGLLRVHRRAVRSHANV